MSVNEIAFGSNPMAEEATVGKDYLLFVAGIIGNDTSESWNIIGGQTSASIDESTDEIDVTTKTSGGYKATLPGLTSWSIDFDSIALLPNSDTGVEILRRAKIQGARVKIKILYPDGSYRVGWATTTTYTVDAPHDKDATLKGKLSGYGPLSDYSTAVNTASATAETFYFSNKATATAVAEGTTAVDSSNYITTTKGQIILSASYLAGLSAGEHLLYVSLSTGGYSLIALDVTSSVTISPTTMSVSKASATDKTFTISPTSATVSSVKNGATALTASTDYTYSSGTLTIKSAYLGGLSTGTATLTVATGAGTNLTITITVTA
ncbi:MAG: phage tail tube protein [Veillonellales bacterium]